MGGTAAGRWREALEVFATLVALEPPQRERELAALSHERPELYPQVRTLLEADRDAQAQAYLAGSASAALDAEPPSSLQAGAEIGPYLLQRLLGSGGMGEVWLAQRRDGLSDAPVALKLLHPHLLHSTLRERFVREGRILGQLAHAHVARLLDAGFAADGQPFLALEYVHGERIDRWCDLRRLDLGARVHVLLQVCEAVAHAHAHLVVHRDLKPSNILVDAGGAIKLLDFGVAKLVEAERAPSASTELTRLGGRALTPEYAAPEQVAGAPLTTAVDQYSLGVLAYVLLSGRRPYGAPGMSVAQLERETLESDPPPPSRARAAKQPALDGEALAALRATSVRKLRQALAGDLDTIVMKTLKKAPEERYPSVLAFAEDLRRWLEHRPVLAQPDSALYRARKFARRHRVGVAAGGAVALALAAGVAGVLWQAQRTAAEARRAQQVKEFLVDVFQQADPGHSQGATLTARALLERGTREIERRLGSEPLLEADFYDALAQIHTSLGQYPRAEELATAALSLRREHLAPDDAHVGESLSTLGAVLVERSEFARARDALVEAAAIMERRYGADSLELARVRSRLGAALSGLGEREAPVALQRQAYETFVRKLGPASAEAGSQLIELGERLEEAGQYADAEARYREALKRLAAALGPEHSEVAEAHLLLGGLLDRTGRPAEADEELTRGIAVLRKVYGDRHPALAEALFSRAVLLIGLRRFAEADAALQETLAIYPAGSYKAAQSERYLGSSLSLQGRYAEAQAQLEKAVADYRASGGPEDAQQYRALADLATAKLRAGDARAAEPLLRQAVREIEQRLGAESYEVRNPLKRLGEAMLALGRDREALAVLQRVHALELKLFNSPEHRELASTECFLAEALLAGGDARRVPEARRYADHSVALYRQHLPGELGRALLVDARAALAAGDRGAALALAREASQALLQSKGAADAKTLEAQGFERELAAVPNRR